MKFVILFAIVATVTAVPLDHDWTNFKTKFNKVYKNAEEEAQRYQIFLKNMDKLKQHNEQAKNGLHSHFLRIDQFSDLTSEEFSKINFGFKNDKKISAPRTHVKGDVSALPASVDWRTKGIVTEVKDQGQCGSCWAFSAVASMESAHAQATGKLVELSEQNLVDCAWYQGSDGCEGGLMDYAFNYTIINGGIDTESSYPYKAEDDYCEFKKTSVGATIKSFTDIPSGDESALADAVAQRVVSVGIDSTNFQGYASGILSTPCHMPAQLDHGVTIVGYGTENGQDYWIVKNSWGKDWGEKGYIRIAKGKNLCGIAENASYPDI